MIGEYLEKFNFEYLIANALKRVPDAVDKREGSIIYDAVAPACYELAEYYMQLRRLLQNTYAETASGQYLDLRAAERGITRFNATYAVKKGIFTDADGAPLVIGIGSRFSAISANQSINYVVTSPYEVDGNIIPGSYQLTCEVAGTSGNTYVGSLMPIEYINGLSAAMMTDLIIPARDTETDEDLRSRYFASLTNKPFGGNLAQYDEALKNIEGVGEVQIYPTWNGGGTVKCSVVDTSYAPVTDDFKPIIQNAVDPEPHGTGLGIAPIGHKVTITTPVTVPINVNALITLTSGYNKSQVEPMIKSALESYIATLRKQWGVPNEANQYQLSVYISRISAAILSIPGVGNVTNITINGEATDLSLTQSAAMQELPILGEVSLDE